MILQTILEILCAILAGVGIIFIYIELRVRIDRSFLLFGVSNLLFCIFCGMDIWIKPLGWDYTKLVVQHVFAPFILPVYLWHIFVLVDKKHPRILALIFANATLFSVLFVAGVFIRPDAENFGMFTPAYRYVFVPYTVVLLCLIMLYLTAQRQNVSLQKRKVVSMHIGGFVVIAVGSVMDMVLLLRRQTLFSIDSFLLFGALIYGYVMIFSLAQYLLNLSVERKRALQNLRSAYSELNSQKAFRILGESASKISHEIKNYAFSIGGLAAMLRGKIDPSFALQREITGDIIDCAEKLSLFSRDVLELAGARDQSNFVSVSINTLVADCINRHFKGKKEYFTFCDQGSDIQLFAEPSKLTRALLNIFKNSLEAGATSIDLCCRQTARNTVLSVQDNGGGCTAEQLAHMFDAFYTTKTSQEGTGLGMPIVQNIVEGHGGSVHVWSLQGSSGVGSGLYVELFLPGSKTPKVQQFALPVVYILKDVPQVQHLLFLFQQCGIEPRIQDEWGQISSIKPPFNKSEYVLAPKREDMPHGRNDIARKNMYITSTDSGVVVEHSSGGEPVLVTGRWIAETFLSTAMQQP